MIGAGEATRAEARAAEETGRLLARGGAVLVTGGLGGVMEAASRGARKEGGLVVGVVPQETANAWVDVVIKTGMGDARNVILANTADAFIAIGGSHGTLSEIAFALKRGKAVVSLGSWEVDPAIRRARTPRQAVRLALSR